MHAEILQAPRLNYTDNFINTCNILHKTMETQDPTSVFVPNVVYAVRFHPDYRGRGLGVLMKYSQEFAGMRGGIYLVHQRYLPLLDREGIQYDQFEMRGRHTPDEILAHWDAQKQVEQPVVVQTPAEDKTRQQRPTLARSLFDCIREWYGSR